jgi:hypothetical protein
MIDAMTSSMLSPHGKPVGNTRPLVAVVGIGAMGLPMALRLQASGLTVRAVDVSAGRVSECREQGLEADTDLGLLAAWTSSSPWLRPARNCSICSALTW